MSELLDTARNRLQQERREWRRDHPVGFVAQPKKLPDGSVDMFTWICGIPGKKGGDWEGATYKLILQFKDDYPGSAPKAVFDPPLFHVNVFPSGTVCLSILNDDKDYVPGITVKQILLGIQDLLENPNIMDPAQRDAAVLFKSSVPAYKARVRELAKAYAEAHNEAL